MPLVLASTSVFRRELLQRLRLDFSCFAPQVDETPLPQESPSALVLRLAQLKAQSAKAEYPQALSIGSDQVAVIGEQILGKPGRHEQATAQLRMASGQRVDFLTGVCLYNTASAQLQTELSVFSVQFRHLTDAQIARYLHKEQPYNCAGSFKSEGFGIALLERMEGADPTSLIGLPLMLLVRMLETAGVQVI